MDVSFEGERELDRTFTELPPSVLAAIRRAADANALEFMSQVASIVPLDDKEGVHLVSTLAKAPADNGSGVQVSIGGPEAPYPAHLEFGHMTPGGKHVPGKPFWFPVLRLTRKKFRARITRAARDAIKRLASNGPA